MNARTQLIDNIQAVEAIAHPLRLRLLDALREPDSAAGAARALGLSRQSVNYHVKELERAGLLRPAGVRRKGGLEEQLYQCAAGTLVISPRLAWGSGSRAEALGEQLALANLVQLGERLQQDAAALLDRAAFEEAEIHSAAVEATVCFPDAQARSEFMREYLELLGPLLKKHGARKGDRFRAALAVYPIEEEP